MTRKPRDERRSDGPERRCIVTGDRCCADGLIRFVLAPDGTVVPDLDARLPGRGLWLSARRDVVKAACAKRAFARAARTAAIVPDDLDDRLEALLIRRCVDRLGLARRAGQAVAGFEKVRARLKEGRSGLLLGARDGTDDGRAKLRGLSPGGPERAELAADELGAAFGRDRAVHAWVADGGLARGLDRELDRLAGFRGNDDPVSDRAGRADPDAWRRGGTEGT